MASIGGARAYGILALRLITGWYFLYAGLDKVASFIGGNEPFTAAGFLSFGTAGTTAASVAEGTVVNPTAGFWADLAANPAALGLIDFIVPFGQVAIGLALMLGLATRFAAVTGFLMMAFITVAAWDFAHGIINATSFLGLVALVLGVIRAGEVFGLDAIVTERPVVKRMPALRLVLG